MTYDDWRTRAPEDTDLPAVEPSACEMYGCQRPVRVAVDYTDMAGRPCLALVCSEHSKVEP